MLSVISPNFAAAAKLSTSPKAFFISICKLGSPGSFKSLVSRYSAFLPFINWLRTGAPIVSEAELTTLPEVSQRVISLPP